jgi:hypothetical protein
VGTESKPFSPVSWRGRTPSDTKQPSIAFASNGPLFTSGSDRKPSSAAFAFNGPWVNLIAGNCVPFNKFHKNTQIFGANRLKHVIGVL